MVSIAPNAAASSVVDSAPLATAQAAIRPGARRCLKGFMAAQSALARRANEDGVDGRELDLIHVEKGRSSICCNDRSGPGMNGPKWLPLQQIEERPYSFHPPPSDW